MKPRCQTLHSFHPGVTSGSGCKRSGRGGSGLLEPGREPQGRQGVTLARLCLAVGCGEGLILPGSSMHSVQSAVGCWPAGKQVQVLGPWDVSGCRLEVSPPYSSLWEMLGRMLVSSSRAALVLCAYRSRSASSVTAGTGPACAQRPHNAMLLRAGEGGSSGRSPCAAASA